jgi:prepilin-type processing-associated H-X9-DG protein
MNRSNRRSDLAVSLVLVLLFSGYTLAQFERAREVADRVKCASNLRQIGQAILLYSNDNKGNYPRTMWDTQNATPTWGTPYQDTPKLGAQPDKNADPFDPKNSKVVPAANDVTAAIFLLLRTQDITSEVFVCPSTGLEKWDYGGGTNAPINWSNWPGKDAIRDHLSYSMQNPYPTKEAIAKGWKWNNTLGAEFAIAADMNPGTEALLKLNPTSPYQQMLAGNSANHNRDGQNILYGDGHVAWEANPFVGVNRDNIYTVGESMKKGGDAIVGASTSADDSIVLPTEVDVGFLDKTGELTDAARTMQDKRVGLEPAKPEELAAAGAKIVGRYARDDAKAGKLTLEITKDKITLVKGGQTIAYDCRIASVTADGGVRMRIVAPGALQSETIAAWPEADGKTMFLAGNVDLAGKWTKQP